MQTQRIQPNYISVASNKLTTDKLKELRIALRNFIEKGNPLELPSETEIPDCVKETFAQAANSLSGEELKNLIQKKVFGIAEESSDILYYLTIKAGFDSGVFTKERLEKFQQSVQDLLPYCSLESFKKIKIAADKEIKIEDISKMLPYYPQEDNLRLNEIVRDYLRMLFVDFAVKVYQNRKGADFSNPKVIIGKLEEETKELFEALSRTPSTKQVVPTTSEEQQKLVREIVGLGKNVLNPNSFTLENLLQFNLWKSSARTEFFYKNPNLPYDEAKQIAKAWEKILEASTFLK